MTIYTKEDLLKQLEAMPVEHTDTIMMHSSMKAIGEVVGGGDTVLDALSEYFADGLLVLPQHTYETIGPDNPTFYADKTRPHIGILTELFHDRPEVVRSLHPTHSVGAFGEDAIDFTADHENFDTPAAEGSPYWKLLERHAKILLVGVDLVRNTYIHGIEEWVDIPGRLGDTHQDLITVSPNGTEIPVPSLRHVPGISKHYWKVEKILADKGAIEYAQLGDAKVLVCDAERLNHFISQMLEIDPTIFSDVEPLSKENTEKFNALK